IVPIRTKVGCCKELETKLIGSYMFLILIRVFKNSRVNIGYIGKSLTHEMVEMLADWKEHVLNRSYSD
ncbi:MAG: hypothetical protein V8R91_17145, partial [Butyricimonas faecihominis]